MKIKNWYILKDNIKRLMGLSTFLVLRYYDDKRIEKESLEKCKKICDFKYAYIQNKDDWKDCYLKCKKKN